MTWGHVDSFRDNMRVRDQLRNPQQIHATGGAFAAILPDGLVVTWGNQQIHATSFSFAAILADKSVVVCLWWQKRES